MRRSYEQCDVTVSQSVSYHVGRFGWSGELFRFSFTNRMCVCVVSKKGGGEGGGGVVGNATARTMLFFLIMAVSSSSSTSHVTCDCTPLHLLAQFISARGAR